MKKENRRFKLKTPTVIALSMAIVIAVGTFLLCLPFASRQREWTSFVDSLFTATSAVCVTGLSVVNLWEHYSLFGQIVILILVQIGGLGFITFVSLFTFYIKKKATLSERKLALQSAGGLRFDSIKPQLKNIFLGTLLFEGVGVVLLCVAFIPDFGWGAGIWQGIFTAVSAFCNAGFALTDQFGQVNLCSYAQNPLVSLTVIVLILVGGIGFFVWSDLKKNKFKVKNYSLHTKVVLLVTGILIGVGWVLFAVFEWNNPATLGNFGVGGKLLSSLFMSVTPRTAGFATVDYAYITDSSALLTVLYMFIGGSPGSTAGGIKTTTIAVLIVSAISLIRHREHTVLFKRRVETEVVFHASAVLLLYVTAAILGIFSLSLAEQSNGQASLLAIVLEVTSATGTVGLSVNLTATLSAFSQIVLCMLMFFGRLGGYTLALLFSAERKAVAIDYPKENILIG